MADAWVIMLVYDSFSRPQWGYMLRRFRLRRPMHLYVPLCSTHCSFCEHIAKNVLRKQTASIYHQPCDLPLCFPSFKASLHL